MPNTRKQTETKYHYARDQVNRLFDALSLLEDSQDILDGPFNDVVLWLDGRQYGKNVHTGKSYARYQKGRRDWKRKQEQKRQQALMN